MIEKKENLNNILKITYFISKSPNQFPTKIHEIYNEIS